VLDPGRNCWRVARADRAAFLIDADAYFTAFRQAVARARRSVFILGWDVDSRTTIGRDDAGAPIALLPFLNDALARRPDLRVFVLGWDFSVIFALERESLPAYRFARNAHPRLAFRLDGAHPLGASQHQKIVVVDDTLAFAGGVDLTIRRWDTPAHRADEPRRIDPAGRAYPPLHDVQVMVEGPAAAALGTLARARWRAATGAELPAAAADAAPDPELWPTGVAPDLAAAPIGIARTLPAWDGAPAVHEVAALTLEAIAAARRFIYIEAQYLTSAAVGAALARRLDEPDGPEIVAVLPREERGWLEQSSMGVMRARLLGRLHAADGRGRLRVLHPVVPGLNDGSCVNVHAKVMIVDDALLRVGSANLSNRSMGLDSECDLVLDAALDPRAGGAAAALRDRLLAEHLGVEPRAVADALDARGSLIAAVESLAGGARSLVPLPRPADPGDAALRAAAGRFDLTFLDGLVCDPERPAQDKLLEAFVPEGLRRPVHRSLTGWALGLAALLALAAIWRLTPLRTLLDLERLAALGRTLRTHPAAPVGALAAYLVGGLLLFPITALLAATALVFPARIAIGVCLGGTLASAAVTYGIGVAIGRFRPGWLEGPRIDKLRRQLQQRGMLAVVAARLLPVGNFSLINMTAGALGVRFRDYMLGNLLGVLPGVLGLTLFADRLGSTVRHPHPANFLVLGAVALAFFLVISWLRRRLGARR
jgi:phosphatidylserine/phosphatidylglycerophosphate/cardiolipin synthase-like enzyme/uncharacterized membrane protein YdjX (TVP38/TMEM64 family)